MAKKPIYLEGLNKVLSNLNKEAAAIKQRSMTGLIKGAILIMNDTENTSPITPLHTGNLRASRFIVTAKKSPNIKYSGDFTGADAPELAFNHTKAKSKYQTEAAGYLRPIVIFGFSANYAPYVHELVDKNYRRAGSGAKFLEASVERNKEAVLEIIKNNAKIN